MPHSLVILNGTAPGTILPLDPRASSVTLGRHISNDLQVDDDRASRMHCRVIARGDGWVIEDCDSLNGTRVNSQPITRTVLESGDLIGIGDRLILFLDGDTDDRGSDIQTSVFRATATSEADGLDRPSGLLEESVSESMSRTVRDSEVLCRLANLLHQHTDSEALVRTAIDALAEGLQADSLSIWLSAADGRLRCADSRGEAHEEHLLASLAAERGKAILIDDPSKQEDGDSQHAGMSIGVPIPGPNTCRGAIECHRSSGRRPFRRSDLDFVVVVAHQAGLALENLEHRERLELANAELRRRLTSENRMVGSSKAMRDVFDQITRVGPAHSTVLILGESGSGKELVARSIHDLSRNSAGPYVTVNCAAFSESLLESELFGHEVGAFTGADRRYVGQFERANRGTIFLDEVGEMSLACQAKLLRLLEGHPFQRLGGNEDIVVDVRVIAATHRDLPSLIKDKSFREDLYYRLRVIDIHTPPLRERGDDVIELASLFVEAYHQQVGRGPSRLSSRAVEAIRGYDWPGNVRELKNAVERAVVMGGGDEVDAADLGLPARARDGGLPTQLMTLREAERIYINHVLEQCDGNKTKACRVLGIGRATLYSKLDNA